jgi:ribonuclease HI
MPIDQAISLYKDTRAIARGQQTNAIIAQLKKIETPTKLKGTNPTANFIQVVLSGEEGLAEVNIYTDGSKTDQHVGVGMVVMKESSEIHTYNYCTIFQAELCEIHMAINWIQNQRKKVATYAINVDSKSAILAIANKHTTHPIAVETRRKTIEVRKDTSVKIHWVKGQLSLQGNEKADYMAKIVVSYNTHITYDTIPMSWGKRILEEYYIKIWNVTYTNFEKGPHTKTLIPSIFHMKTQNSLAKPCPYTILDKLRLFPLLPL